MAVQVKLVRFEDGTGDIDNISLLANTDGFDLDYYDGWTQAVPQGLTPGNLAETLNLIATGTDKDDLAANLQGLDDKLKQAEWYWDDPTERYGVWLRAQLTDETNVRQALVRRGEGQPGESLYGPYTDRGNVMRRYALGLERLPWWESVIPISYSATDLSCSGGTASHGIIPGDVPARAYVTNILCSDALDECWFGFRTNRFGTRANFVPQWECDDGTVVDTDDTTKETDYMQTTFTNDATLISRFYVKVSDVTANYSDQRGQFIVLMRAKLSAADTTTRVRLLDGYSTTASNLRWQDRVVIDDTAWKLYSLGTVQIPPTVGLSTMNVFRSYRLCLQAERTAGAGNLRCDKFILIPIGEGALYASNMAMTTSSYAGRVLMRPDNSLSGLTYSDFPNYTNIIASIAPRPQGPYGYTLPVGAGITVFAGQRAASHDETDTVGLYYWTLRRWRTLRGADT